LVKEDQQKIKHRFIDISKTILGIKMNWNTIYITGKSDFREDVRKRLEHTDLKFMPGYIDNSTTSTIHDLYWIDDKAAVRNFKEAIGSKLVWKYRLQFYDCLEKFIQSQNESQSADFTSEELSMIEEVKDHMLHPELYPSH